MTAWETNNVALLVHKNRPNGGEVKAPLWLNRLSGTN